MTCNQMEKLARVIAFYLPQFHPILENDKWWGKGFTEWTNVAKAKPLFRGHYQPHVPADLGFYDLRVPETRAAQAELAAQYGVEAFCYYHYWFAGKRLLERPFEEVLVSGQPDFPFCLCWANKTWTGIWHGAPERILIEQTYPGMRDHEAHFNILLKAFSDDRYLTVDGRPVFVVYHPRDIPDLERVTDYWRELALKQGLKGLYLVGVRHSYRWDPQEYGFDATVDQRLPPRTGYIPARLANLKFQQLLSRPKGGLTVYDYRDVLDYMVRKSFSKWEDYPCVVPNWDNTPRSGLNGLVLHGSSPELFKCQLDKAVSRVKELPSDHRLVFLKSWNEWAEGNYVEPDLCFGHGYLQTIKEAVFVNQETSGSSFAQGPRAVQVS